MTYPREFVEKVCAEYSGSPDVRSAASAGKYGLGVLLSRGAVMTMSPEDIVTSIDSGECRQVREDAATAVRRRSLHAEWMRIVCRSLSVAGDIVASVPPPSRRSPRPRLSEVSP
jgi:hypothetical protein